MKQDDYLDLSVLDSLPVPDENKLNRDYEEALSRFSLKVIALDDDPTGVQTVHDISVFTDWSENTFIEGFMESNHLFFILTNSRAMPEHITVEIHRQMAERIHQASEKTGKGYILISRSDSTLRGHYPSEPETLRKVIEEMSGVHFDGEIIYPFFKEGGRYTINNIHYVREGNQLTPAGMTEFAKDKTFGYHSSHLGRWVGEKSGGKYKEEDCIYISLEDLRDLQYEKITDQLMSASDFSKIIVNSVDYCDVKAFAISLINAVNQGKHYIIRSAAAIAKVLGGITDAPLLRRDQLITPSNSNGGLVIIGSHVKKTSQQLDELKNSGLPLSFMEFDVGSALVEHGLEQERKRLRDKVEGLIKNGQTAVVYTSRKLLKTDGADREQQLAVSVGISDSLTGIVSDLSVRPSFIIAKGGITSSDVGTKALRVHRATVMGQIKPGIPVWMTGEESKFPNMPYVIFPGNVGEISTLKEIVQELMGLSLADGT